MTTLRPPESSMTRRRRALGLTVDALAYTARIRKSQVSRPDGIALLRIEWVLRQLESGWSLQQVRQVIEYRLRNAGSQATASAAVAGAASTPAGGRRRASIGASGPRAFQQNLGDA